MATLAELQADLVLYKAARNKILVGQSYSIGDVTLARPDLKVVESRIRDLEFQISRFQGLTHSYPIFGGKR